MSKKRFLSACLVVLFLSVQSGCERHLSAGLTEGQLAPSLPTKTLVDAGGDFSKVTTYRQPDARMYQYSVDKALQAGRPIILEFATPGHCTNCDAQLQMLKAITDRYQNQMIVIHIDQYANPQAYRAYNVMGDPWTFIIDKNGIVRFESAGRMLLGEMEAAIQRVLVVDS